MKSTVQLHKKAERIARHQDLVVNTLEAWGFYGIAHDVNRWYNKRLYSLELQILIGESLG